MASPTDKSPGSTPPSLLQRALENEANAWETLVEWTRATVLACCRRAGLQDADLWEVSQEVLLRVSQKLATFVRRTSFRAWVRSITRTCIADRFRDRRRSDKVLAAFLEQNPPVDAANPASDAEDRESAVKMLVRQMKDRHGNDKGFLAFYRVTVDTVATSDVAQELGLKKESVRAHVSRWRKRLRKEFAETFEDLFPSDPTKRPGWPQ